MTRLARFLVVCLVVQALALRADVRLPKVLSKNMLLQQGEKIRIWGWADSGEKVVVTLGGNKAETIADEKGCWVCFLPPLPASNTPMTMTVSGKNTLTVDNILIGELWLCAGQSNMGLLLSASKDGDEEAKKANYPSIRLLLISGPRAETPQEDAKCEWQACSPKFAAQFSAVAYYFGKQLSQEMKVPIGLIGEGWGGSAIEEWIPRQTFETDPELAEYPKKIAALEAEYPKLKEAWDQKMEKWKATPEKDRYKWPPNPLVPIKGVFGGIYHALVAPLTGLRLAGIIWYQGESNVSHELYFASTAEGYVKELPALIRTIRKDFQQPDLPFIFVQLPGCGEPTTDANRASQLADLREAQAMTLSVPNTAMAVTLDVGEANNSHPRNKKPVGERLAVLARVLKYKQTIPNYCSPLFDSLRVDGARLIVKFKYAENGLVVKGDKAMGFAIAGADGKYSWANAAVEGDSVILTSDKVANPVSVRYGWANTPEANLYNQAGLPVGPFRAGEGSGAVAPVKANP